MLLKNYQEKRVQELISTTLRLVSESGSKSIVFKAPTGSGKTVMMQEYLRRLADTPMSQEYAFVWISVNDLSRQSKKSFEKNLAWSALHFSELSDIADRELKKALIEMRDEIGNDKTYSFIKEAMEALIGTPTFKKAVTKKALKK